MADGTKSRLELITDFLNVVLWPIIILIIIIVFWHPIKGLIDNSETISIGNLSVKVRNEMPTPSTSVKEVLTNLNSTDISEILYLGNDTSEYNGYNEGSLEDAPINKLVSLKLLREVEYLDGDPSYYYFKITQLGADTYDFYIELLYVLGKQIDKPETNN